MSCWWCSCREKIDLKTSIAWFSLERGRRGAAGRVISHNRKQHVFFPVLKAGDQTSLQLAVTESTWLPITTGFSPSIVMQDNWQQIMEVGIDDPKGAGILPPSFKVYLFWCNSVSASVLHPAPSGAVICAACCSQHQITFRTGVCKALPILDCIITTGRDGCSQESFLLFRHKRKIKRWPDMNEESRGNK